MISNEKQKRGHTPDTCYNSFFSAEKEKVPEYFPFETVLEGLFDLCNKLFDISFEVGTHYSTAFSFPFFCSFAFKKCKLSLYIFYHCFCMCVMRGHCFVYYLDIL